MIAHVSFESRFSILDPELFITFSLRVFVKLIRYKKSSTRAIFLQKVSLLNLYCTCFLESKYSGSGIVHKNAN